MLIRTLSPADPFCKRNKISINTFRYWWTNRDENGCEEAEAIVKIGRKLYADEERFWIWNRQRNERNKNRSQAA